MSRKARVECPVCSRMVELVRNPAGQSILPVIKWHLRSPIAKCEASLLTPQAARRQEVAIG